MPRIIYVNGRYLQRAEALVSCEDRGYQFGDGVYEGIELHDGKPVDLDRHLQRLARSMQEIGLVNQPGMDQLRHIISETARRNRYRNGFIYLQITRGVATRDYVFPAEDTPTAITCMVYQVPQLKYDKLAQSGLKAISLPDQRWKRPDIKSLQLLPGVLARQAARSQGAQEAWLLDEDGKVTEGAASNAWIVTAENRLVTRRANENILRGVTRHAVLDMIEAKGMQVEQRAFHIEEAYQAHEAFITASTNTVMPVVQIDNNLIGNGKPGAVTRSLRALYRQRSDAS